MTQCQYRSNPIIRCQELCCGLPTVGISEKEEELDSTTSRLNRQLADVEFARSTLERQKSSLESDLTASQQEVAGLKSTVAQMSAAQAGIEAELAATKVTAAAEQLGEIRPYICSLQVISIVVNTYDVTVLMFIMNYILYT